MIANVIQDFTKQGAEGNDTLNKFGLDIQKFTKSLEVHNKKIGSWSDMFNKFNNILFGYSEAASKRIFNSLTYIGNKMENEFEIVEKEMDKWKKEAETNRAAAKVVELIKQKQKLFEIKDRMAEKDITLTQQEIDFYLRSMQALEKAGAIEVQAGIRFKKSDYILKQIGVLEDKNTDVELKRKTGDSLLNTLEMMGTKGKEYENIKESIKSGNYGKATGEGKKIAAKVAKNPAKDEAVFNSIAGAKEAGFTEAGVAGGDIAGAGEMMGGAGGLLSGALGAALPVVGLAVAGGMMAGKELLGAPAKATSILDQTADFLLLAAIVIPFIWNKVSELWSGKHHATPKELADAKKEGAKEQAEQKQGWFYKSVNTLTTGGKETTIEQDKELIQRNKNIVQQYDTIIAKRIKAEGKDARVENLEEEKAKLQGSIAQREAELKVKEAAHKNSEALQEHKKSEASKQVSGQVAPTPKSTTGATSGSKKFSVVSKLPLSTVTPNANSYSGNNGGK